jgi:hypothetical protein
MARQSPGCSALSSSAHAASQEKPGCRRKDRKSQESMMVLGRVFILAGLTIIAAVPLIQAAYAQDFQLLRGADTDGDGAISIAEATKVLQQEYQSLDANHDGTVSEDEFVNARLAQLAKLDTNGDGKITRDEMRARLRSLRP